MAAEYRAALDAELARWKALLQTDGAAINRRLTAAGLPPITPAR
jgi:hypothetical protein